MKLFSREELLLFLRDVDGRLSARIEVLMVGSGATQFAYGTTRGTLDIDLFQYPKGTLEVAWKAARKATGLAIELDGAAIADLPWNADDRKVRIDLGLAKLDIFVPERHDLALMKILASRPHDRQALLEMHAIEPFDQRLLLSRFLAELGHAIGRQAEIDWRFTQIIEMLFGEAAAEDAAAKIAQAR